MPAFSRMARKSAGLARRSLLKIPFRAQRGQLLGHGDVDKLIKGCAFLLDDIAQFVQDQVCKRSA